MSIRQSAIKGAGYASAAVIAGRSTTFLSQLILGWVLAKEDFAIFALAVGVMAFTNALSHGGAHILMLQASDRIDRVLPAGMRLAAIFDIGIPLIIAALAWPIAKSYGSPELAPILWIIVGSFPLRLLALPCRMRAAAKGQFGDVSFADFAQSFTQQLLIVLFALCGFGVFAFVLGQPIVNVLDWLILRKRIGPAEKGTSDPIPLKSLIKPASLVLVTALGIALAVGSAENLILGELAPAILAYYFFAYRITASINQVFGGSIRSVLVPSFAKIKEEPKRMQAAGVRACQTSFFVTIPLFYMIAFMIGPVIHFLWQGKWDESAIVAFALILAQPNRLGLFINRSFLEARGQWSAAAAMVWVDGILLALTVFLVATKTKDLTTIAFTIAAYRGLGGLVLSLVALKLGGISLGRVLPLLMVPIVAALAMVPAWYFSGGHPGTNTSLLNSMVSIGIFAACYAVLGACFLRSQFRQTLSAISLRK
ncbi:MAG: oligosaccharide flippase family protein [Phycisphaerales bacterium]|nr:oligosaccharide flippase family protein [Phycisphaerales bacterium]